MGEGIRGSGFGVRGSGFGKKSYRWDLGSLVSGPKVFLGDLNGGKSLESERLWSEVSANLVSGEVLLREVRSPQVGGNRRVK